MVRSLAWWLAGVAGIMVFLEVVLRLLPVSTSTQTGYFYDPLILTYPPHHRWTSSTGWDLRHAQKLESNNWGFLADRDFNYDANAVGLVGDSFIEASALEAHDRPGAQLERLLRSRPVFAMGNPGTSLLDYAERIRFANERFGVKDFVVFLENGDVRQSLCGSGNNHGPCRTPGTLVPRTETLPPPGLVKKILRRSALAQYLTSQLKLDPAALMRQPIFSAPAAAGENPQPMAVQRLPEAEPDTTLVDVVTTAFFDRIRPYATGRLIIVVDSDRPTQRTRPSAPNPEKMQFMELARQHGAIVVDTAALFSAHVAQSKLSLEMSPQDKHFNALGIKIVVQAAAEVLNGR